MKRIIVGVIVIMLILISGCSKTEYSDEFSDNPYSREHIYWLSQSNSFGTQRSDDEILALKYLYDSKEVSEIYGDKF